jgi:hypothetical protein
VPLKRVLALVVIWIGGSNAFAAGSPPGEPHANGGAAALAPLSIDTQLLATQPGADLTLAIGDATRDVSVSREGVSGPGVELHRSGPGEMRGDVGTESVIARLEPGRIDGTIGDHAIALDVLRSPRLLRIDGRFGEKAVVLDVAPNRIAGEVGTCLYNLSVQPGSTAYVGHVLCGATRENVRLTVPPGLLARGDAELATLITAILAR